MDEWTIGLVAILVVGILVIGYGALSDRAKNRRAAAAMLSPPRREIPAFDPATPAPHYLSELQAHRPPASAVSTELSTEQRQDLARRLTEPSTVALDAVLVSRDFLTDTHAGWAVLDGPRVAVCAEPVGTLREIMPVLEAVSRAQVPLVLAAPSLAGEVTKTLEVNAIQQTLKVLAVTAPAAVLGRAAEVTRTEPISRTDLQSGYVALNRLGGCERWVSDNRRSYIFPSNQATP